MKIRDQFCACKDDESQQLLWRFQNTVNCKKIKVGVKNICKKEIKTSENYL